MDKLVDPVRNGSMKPFVVSHRMVITLALPMTLAYMTTPVLGLVDTAVVGRLGDAALIGGLAVGAILIDVIFTTFNFLRSGTTGLTAQAVGREDEVEKQAILIRALMIAVGAGIAMFILSPLILKLGLWAIDPAGHVAEATATYFVIRIIGSPFALANYAILGWMIGLGRTGLGLLIQTVLNSVNIVLSMFLGLVAGYGLPGVAAATVISELAATILGLIICWRLMDRNARPSRARIANMEALKRFANLNADIMIRSFVLLSAFAFFTAQGARLGDTQLAANAVLMNFFVISGFFLDGLATAAEQIVGRSIGANCRPGFWRGFRLTLLWNITLAGMLSLCFWFFGHQLIDLITTVEPVRAAAYDYLIFASLTAVTGVLAFQMDGVYIGATWSREMSRMMVLSFIAYLVAWWSLRDFGNAGLWIALHVFLIMRGITLSIRLPVRAKAAFD
jgi:multidrug resistance protein, MATE family